MGIRFEKDSRLFVLTTEHSEYQMKVDSIGLLLHTYYGAPVGGTDMSYQFCFVDRGYYGNPYEYRDNRPLSMDAFPQEYSGFGVGDFRTASVMLTAADGISSCDLRYVRHEILPGKYMLPGLPGVRGSNGDLADESEVMTLAVYLQDEVTGLAVKLLYGVFEKKDVITRAAVLTNNGSETLVLKKAASACVDFLYGEHDLIHFEGRHAMERIPERHAVSHDITVIGAKRGHSSHANNPFVILCDKNTTETAGDAYGFMLVYSGSHKTEVEMDQTGSTRVVMGISDEGFCWQLAGRESLALPEVILSYSGEGLEGLSHHYHHIIRENVIDAKYYHMQRPVLVNNWEATYFDFDAGKILQIADAAAEIGVEMLVLDDGWFGIRDRDVSGLGDWYVNTKKLGCSMGELADGINARGLKFGLWFEPEMISEDSDLYRAHPDWALTEPGRRPSMSRCQLVLDMSRQEVQDYLFDRMEEVLSGANISYVKWDFNRSVTNLYSHALPADRQGELPYRFLLGTYALLERLLARFPYLMIEGCCGGGGRFDAGMLYYCPQIWCSDNTDPIARLTIQEGSSYGYPVSAMGSHVSASPNHQTGRATSLHTRGLVAMAGTFGYELDLSKQSQAEKEVMKQQIRDFHKYYFLIQHGEYYRLSADRDYIGGRAFSGERNFFTAWEFAAADGSEALVTMAIHTIAADPVVPHVKLRGLRADAVYELEGSGRRFSGAALMRGGFADQEIFWQKDEKGIADSYPAKQYHFVRVSRKTACEAAR